MRKKKVLLLVAGFVGCCLIGAYFAIPPVLENLLKQSLTEHESNSVQSVQVSWTGPQRIYGLHVESKHGSADVDIEILSGLFGIVTGDHYSVLVHGDAVLHTTAIDEIAAPQNGSVAVAEENGKHDTAVFTFPAISVDVQLDTLTVQGDEPLVYSNLLASVIIKPGSVFSFQIQAVTDTDGAIVCSGDAPDLLTEQGEINCDASASVGIAIKNAAIPTIHGQGGWSVVDLAGEISSAKLRESIVVSMVGRFAQYDVSKGYAAIKTQFHLGQDFSNAFSLSDNQLVGTIDVQDVPTSILAPLVTRYGIDTTRDLGETMEIHVSRTAEDASLQFSFTSEQVNATGTIQPDENYIENVTLTANLQDEFVRHISDGELQGTANVSAFLSHLVLSGQSTNGKNECEGNVIVKGALVHVPTNTDITFLQTDFFADIRTRKLSTSGLSILNERNVTFASSLVSTTKNKLHGVEDLLRTITNQLPNGNGVFAFEHAPISILQQYLPEDQREYAVILGDDFSVNTTLSQSTAQIEIGSDTTQLQGVFLLEGKEITGAKDIEIYSVLTPAVASELFGATIVNESIFRSTISSLQWDGSSTFTATYDIDTKSTFVNGSTTRVAEGERAGQLDAHLAVTGIDMPLVDAVLQYDNILADSLGSPLAVEIIASDITGNLVVRGSGNSPKSAFETTLGFFDGNVFTIPETTTLGSLHLSPELTQHLLKDLGPVLSDIRTVNHPIEITITNANTNLQGDISSLNANIFINIGEVELDSGAATLKLLPMFNTQHIALIPAFFDPIYIEIRDGIAQYKKFNLTLVDKFSIPYSGSVNLVKRTLDIKTAIPLTGLGYSIKELRGLTDDIDVPILITGSIDNPKTQVDPSFDLGKILQNAAVSALGDAIGGVLQGGNENREAPNPLDLLEDLLGGN